MQYVVALKHTILETFFFVEVIDVCKCNEMKSFNFYIIKSKKALTESLTLFY